MCRSISGFLLETGAPIISIATDSHSEIAERNKICIEMGGRVLALAFELAPPDNNPFAPSDRWKIKIEDREPQWFEEDREGGRERIRRFASSLIARKVYDGRDVKIKGDCSIAACNCTVTLTGEVKTVRLEPGSKNVTILTPDKIGGWLDAQGSTGLALPVLTEVGGDLDVKGSTGLTLPMLTGVGGRLYAQNTTGLTLPVLTEVVGRLDARNTTGLTLPMLTEVGWGINARNAVDLHAPKLKQ